MPSSSSKISHRIQGNALVLLQFGLIVSLILMTNPADALRAGHLAVWGILGASALVGLAAVLANPPGNFNIRPDPKPGGRLVEHGIYRRVRHPMYTAVTLFGLGCAAATPSANAWLAAGFLFLACGQGNGRGARTVPGARGLRGLHAAHRAVCSQGVLAVLTD